MAEARGLMVRWMIAAGMALMAGPALAQGGNCITGNLLRVDAAFARHGAGGTFDYSVQVTNMTAREVTFRVNFRMTNTTTNPALFSTVFRLPPNGNRVIIVGNGREQSTPSRIGGGVVLTC